MKKASKLAVARAPAPVAPTLAIPLSEIGDSDDVGRFEEMRREDESEDEAQQSVAEVGEALLHEDCVFMTRGDQRTHVNHNSVAIMEGLGWELEKLTAKAKKGR